MKVGFDADDIVIELRDGRAILVPLNWFPRLEQATRRQRMNWRLIGGGIGIHWSELDEDISVEHLLGNDPPNATRQFEAPIVLSTPSDIKRPRPGRRGHITTVGAPD